MTTLVKNVLKLALVIAPVAAIGYFVVTNQQEVSAVCSVVEAYPGPANMNIRSIDCDEISVTLETVLDEIPRSEEEAEALTSNILNDFINYLWYQEIDVREERMAIVVSAYYSAGTGSDGEEIILHYGALHYDPFNHETEFHRSQDAF